MNQRQGRNASKSSLWKGKCNIFRGFIASYHLFHVQRLMAAFITRVRTKCRKSKGERDQTEKLWSVVRQRNSRKFITRISTAKKKLHPGTHLAMHYCDMPQQWLWACGWWKKDDHDHAVLPLGLEVETHSKLDSVILMQHYIAQHEYVLGEGLQTNQLTQSCLNYHFVLHIPVAHKFWCIEILILNQYLKTNPAPLTWKKALKSLPLTFLTFNPHLCKNMIHHI